MVVEGGAANNSIEDGVGLIWMCLRAFILISRSLSSVANEGLLGVGRVDKGKRDVRG